MSNDYMQPDFPRGRKVTDKRGGQLEPAGDQTPGPTSSERGKYPMDAGGPAKPNSSSATEGGPSGSPYETRAEPNFVDPVPTRPTPTAPTMTNPIK